MRRESLSRSGGRDVSRGEVPAGWFPDPTGKPGLRWWDGQQWTGNMSRVPAVAPAQASATQARFIPTDGTDSSAKSELSVTAAMTDDFGKRKSGLFGSKRHLEEEINRLRQLVDSMGITEREHLRAELEELREVLPPMRLERESLTAGLERLRAETVGLESARAELTGIAQETGRLQAQRATLAEGMAEYEQFRQQQTTLVAELDQLRRQVVDTQEAIILQEVGIYRYRHPLDDAVAYKARLSGLQAQIKDAVRAGSAVQGATNWTVNGSVTQGRKMVREFSKLMLRAYNAEADNAVRSMKPYTLESAIARLEKSRDTIVKLGGTMNIRIADHYHRLRVTELELTADYLAKAAEAKERERSERERLRDEERARRELERELERLRKEQEHYMTVLATYQAQGDAGAAAKAEAKLAEIADGLDGLNRRAANIRAGYVYVISNVGAFGPNMVKIGMTRRLEPMDRIRELGDASVPFLYDVHALVFSEDAVGLETHLHHELAERRVNMVNARREFFYASPAAVRDILSALDLSMLSYVDEPEALEWHQSQTARGAGESSGTKA
jgi:hypothetical protein